MTKSTLIIIILSIVSLFPLPPPVFSVSRTKEEILDWLEEPAKKPKLKGLKGVEFSVASRLRIELNPEMGRIDLDGKYTQDNCGRPICAVLRKLRTIVKAGISDQDDFEHVAEQILREFRDKVGRTKMSTFADSINTFCELEDKSFRNEYPDKDIEDITLHSSFISAEDMLQLWNEYQTHLKTKFYMKYNVHDCTFATSVLLKQSILVLPKCLQDIGYRNDSNFKSDKVCYSLLNCLASSSYPTLKHMNVETEKEALASYLLEKLNDEENPETSEGQERDKEAVHQYGIFLRSGIDILYDLCGETAGKTRFVRKSLYEFIFWLAESLHASNCVTHMDGEPTSLGLRRIFWRNKRRHAYVDALESAVDRAMDLYEIPERNFPEPVVPELLERFGGIYGSFMLLYEEIAESETLTGEFGNS